MATHIATATSTAHTVTGTVIARSPDGTERLLKAGDPIYSTDTIITRTGGTIQFTLQNGYQVEVVPGRVFSLADFIEQKGWEWQGEPGVEEMQELLASDQDPSQDLPATASGPTDNADDELTVEDIENLPPPTAGAEDAGGFQETPVILPFEIRRVTPETQAVDTGNGGVGNNSGGEGIFPGSELIADTLTDGTIFTVADSTGNEDTAIALNLNAILVDQDGSEVLDLTLSGIPSGSILTDGTNTVTSDGSFIDISDWTLSSITLTPPQDYNNVQNSPITVTLTVTATETGSGNTVSDSENFIVNVTPVNDDPTVVAIGPVTTDEDAAILSVDLLDGAADVDDDDLDVNSVIASVTEGVGPENAITFTVDEEAGQLQIDPDQFTYLADGESVTLTFNYNVNDGTVDVANTATVTIAGRNDQPVVQNTVLAALENQLLDDGESEQAIFEGQLAVSDVDTTDTHTFSLVAGSINTTGGETEPSSPQEQEEDILLIPEAVPEGLIVDPERTIVTVNPDGSYSVKNPDFNRLADGEQIQVSFRYIATDDSGTGNAASEEKTVTLTITGNNDQPQIENADTTGVVTEGDEVLSDSGSIEFSDIDSSDRPTATEATKSVTPNGGLVLTGAQQTALEDAFTIIPAGSNTNNGSINWDYSITESELDFLAAGESVTLVYTVTVDDDNGGTARQDVEITVTGTNDTPTITSDAQSGSITEGDEVLNDTGTITFEDVDLSDRPTATEATKSVTPNGGLVLTGAQQTALEDAFTIIPAGSNTNNGSINWDYSITESELDFLAAGESVTLVYTVTVDDDNGGTARQDVEITVTGTNDTPTITSDAQSGSITEGDEVLNDTGTITFEDVDLSDRPTATEATKSVTPNGGLVLTGAQQTALEDAFTITPAGSNTNNGSISWDYSITESELDFLAAGESVTLVYTVTVDDDNGGTARQDVEITVTGTNDTPTITSDAQSGSITEGDEVLNDTGTITFEDVDLSDRPTATEATKSVTPNGGLVLTGAQQTALEDAFTITPAGSNTNNGSISWDYSITESELDFLAAGESVTLVYTVTVDDDNGGTAKQDVEITVTGTNDTPTMTSDAQSGSITEGDEVLNDTGTITFEDVDLSDRPTATEATKSVTPNGGLVLTGAQQTALEDAFTIIPAGSNTNNGSINWDYSITESELDFLAAGESVTLVYTVTVDDDNGGTAKQDVEITVTGTNDLPITSAVTQLHNEDSIVADDAVVTKENGLLKNASDVDASDVLQIIEGDIGERNVVLSFTDGQGVPSLVPVQLIINADGSYTIKQTSAINAIPAGQTASASFNLTFTDGLETVTQPVIVEISGANDAPVSTGELILPQVDENALAGGEVRDESSGALLANAEDVDNNSLTIADIGDHPVTMSYEGSDGQTYDFDVVLNVQADGSYTIKQAPDSVHGIPKDIIASGSVMLTVTDGDLTTEQKVTIQVKGQNDEAIVKIDSNVLQDTNVTEAGGIDNAQPGDPDASGKLLVEDVDSGEAVFKTPTNLEGQYGTFTFTAATGAWTYLLNQAKADLLTDGEPATDTLAVESLDGTATQNIVVNITGSNDNATITVDNSATQDTNVTEAGGIDNAQPGDPDASGKLLVEDVDSGEAVFKTPTNLEGQYGTFTFTAATGAWTYLLNQTKADLLTDGEPATDTLAVESLDGTATQNIVVNITGSNDNATITVDNSATQDTNVTEAGGIDNAQPGDPDASGKLLVEDVDSGEAVFKTPTNLEGQYGTFTFTAATGAWTYLLNQAKADLLTDGEPATDTLAVESLDGTATQNIVVNITGSNDNATITVDNSATQDTNVTEAGGIDNAQPGDPDASGKLLVEDVDSGEAVFKTPTNLEGQYGTFTFTAATGAWTYLLNQAKADLLTDGEPATDTLAVESLDGTATQNIVVNITGSNDNATITVDNSATQDTNVTEAGGIDNAQPGDPDASGKLLVEDVDSGEAVFKTPTNLEGQYGTFTFTAATGAWTYLLNQAKADLLTDGEPATDTLAVESLDGTATQNIVVNITGSNDNATITVDNSATQDTNVTEAGGIDNAQPGDPDASGKLLVEDVDSGEAVFKTPTNLEGQYGTFTFTAATGAWTYLLNQAKADLLTDGEPATDTLAVESLDGTATQNIVVNITGSNDNATITVDNSATQDTNVTEAGGIDNAQPGDPDASGKLLVEDVDSGEAVFKTPTNLEGQYGTFTFTAATGAWTYLLNQAKADLLTDGEPATDTLAVESLDGTATQNIVVNITGSNDNATITVDNSATQDTNVTEAGGIDNAQPGDPDASGKLLVEDVDSGEAVFKTPTNLEGQYGTFTFTAATGAWTYLLNQTKADLLTDGEPATDTLAVESLDGTATQNIVVNITGSNDNATITVDNSATQDTNVTEAGGIDNAQPGDPDASGKLLVEDVDSGEAVFKTPTNLEGQYGTFTFTAATGAWTYLLNQAKADLLTDGEPATDTLAVESLDGTATQNIVVNITGSNDNATITVDNSATQDTNVTEAGGIDNAQPGDPDASGKLLVEDVDSGEAVFKTPTNLEGQYGTFTFTAATGAWTYLLNQAKADLLTDGEPATDTLAVESLDGTATQNIVVNITGSNDNATITVDNSATQDTNVTEAGGIDNAQPGDPDASGKLLVEDVDSGEAVFKTPTNLEGQYGTFTFTAATGAWTYLLNQAKADLLTDGEPATDTLAVESLDGTATQNIVVNITGSNDNATITVDNSATQDTNVTEAGGIDNAQPGDPDASGKLLVEDVDSGEAVFKTPTNLEGQYGTFTFTAATGAWTYLLNQAKADLLTDGEPATDTLAVESLDGTATQNIVVNITGSNDNATITVDNSATQDTNVTEAGGIDNAQPGDPDASGKLLVEDVDSGEAVFKTPTNLEGQYGTFTFTAATGAWTYLLNQAKADLLTDGEPATDTLAVESLDGTATQNIVVNITGSNDNATITVDNSATQDTNVTEAGGIDNAQPGDPDASGKLLVEDVDSGEAVFKTPTNLEGQYGTFTFTAATGAWTYLLNQAKADLLTDGEPATDTLAVESLDGTATQNIVVNITGSNDNATITVDNSATQDTNVTEAGGIDNAQPGDPDASGKLLVEDVDSGEAVFKTPTNLEGQYGTFTFTAATGAWTYLLNQAKADLLTDGEPATDTLAVESLDGTATQNIVVNITGSNDSPIAKDDTNSLELDTVEPGATDGSAATYVVQMEAGGTFSFDWNFNNVETIGSQFKDFAFVSVNGEAQPLAIQADANGQYVWTAPATGTYVITIGVLNDQDTLLDPTLDVTNLTITGGTQTQPQSVIGNSTEITNGIQLRTNGTSASAQDIENQTNNELALLDEIVGDVLANDSDVDANDTLTVQSFDGESIPGTITGTYGDLTWNANGSYSYKIDPARPAYINLNPGEKVQESFGYVVTDGDATDTATLTLNIMGISDIPPTINDPIEEDNIVNAMEDGDVLIEGTAEPGAEVVVTLTEMTSDSPVPKSITVRVMADENGSWTLSGGNEVDISNWENGDVKVSVKATDDYGHKTSSVEKIITLDNQVPGDDDGDGTSDTTPALTIAEASDGYVNADEKSDGVQTQVTLAKGVEVGDTVQLTIAVAGGATQTVSHPVTAGEINGSGALTANITIPKDKLGIDGDYTVTAKVSDAAGNTSGDSTEVNFTLDSKVPGDDDGDGTSDTTPALTIAEASDGYVNADEKSDGVQTQVTLAKGVEVGDTVQLTIAVAGGATQTVSHPVTAGEINGSGALTANITIPKDKLGIDGDYTVTAKVSDAAGNTSGDSTEVNFTLDSKVPGDDDGDGTSDTTPALTIAEASDGYVNADEKSDGVQTQVTLAKGVEVGDTVQLTIAVAGGATQTVSHPVTAGEINGSGALTANITIPKDKLGIDGDYTVTAKVSDAAGNTSGDSTEVNFTLDSKVPGDDDGDGTSDTTPALTIAEASDGYVNADEKSDGVQTQVTLAKGVEVGDTVQLTIAVAGGATQTVSHPVTAGEINGSGALTANITIPKDKLGIDGDYTVTAKVSDAAGNTSGDSTEVNFTLDSKVPGDDDGDGTSDTTPALTIAEASDGYVNADEKSDGVQTQVTLAKGVEVGDTVQLTIAVAGGATQTVSHPVTAGEINGSGALTANITIPKDKLGIDGDYTVTAKVSDAAGNTSGDSTEVNFTLDSKVPGDDDGDGTSDTTPALTIAEASDGYVNADEKSDGVQTQVTLAKGVEVGDTVQLTIAVAGGATQTVSHPVTAGEINGSGALTANITIPKDKLGIDGDYTVTAKVSDAAGNTSGDSTEVNFTLDSKVPGDDDGDGTSDTTPALTIAEASDGYVNADEKSDGVQTQVTLAKGVEVGDTVQLTIAVAGGATQTVSHPVTAGEINGSGALTANITIPKDKLGIDGDYTVTAKVSDAAGNTSGDSTEVNFTLDSKVPGDDDGDGTSDTTPALTIAEASDGYVNADEKSDGVQTQVTLAKGVEVGDTVQLTIAVAGGATQTVSHPVTAGEINGSGALTANITIPKDKLGIDGDYTVTAKVSDAAGNTSGDSTEVNFTLDSKVPGDDDGDGTSDTTPALTIAEASDGYVNADEKSDGVQTQVTLAKGVEVGDTVQLTIAVAGGATQTVSHPVTAGEINGSGALTANITIPKDKLGIDGDYTVTAKVSDAAGNTSGDSTEVNFTLDSKVPGDDDGDGTSDTTPALTIAEASDGYVNADEKSDGVQTQVTLAKGVEVGDTVQLTIAVAGGATQTVSHPVTAGEINGSGALTANITIPKDKLGIDGDYTVTAKVSDAAGNTSGDSTEVNFTLDSKVPGDDDGDGTSDTTPALTIAEASDGYVNADEKSDGVQTQVTLAKGVEVGDTVQLTIAVAGGATQTVSHPVTAGEINGSGALTASITIPKDKLGIDGDYTVTAKVSDAAGNTSGDSTEVNFTLDSKVPGDDDGDGTSDTTPALTIAEASDGYVNADEKSDGVQTQVTLAKGVEVGDTVQLTIAVAGGATQTVSHPVTAGEINGSGALTANITIPKDKLGIDGDYTVTAKVSDAAGNTSGDSTEVNFTLDSKVPGDDDGDGTSDTTPALTIAEASDGYVNADEKSDGVQTQVTLAKGVEVGDTVQLTIAVAGGATQTVSHPVTAGEINGSGALTANITIPKDKLGIDGDYTVTAKVSDAAGNTSGDSTEVNFTLDSKVPGDDDGDGTSDTTPALTIAEASDGYVNADEKSDGVQTQVTLAKGVEVGDTVQLTIAVAGGATQTVSHPVTAGEINGSGALTANITIPKDKLGIDGDYTVTAKVSDAAGNVSDSSNSLTFVLDTVKPDAPIYVPSDIEGDNIVNADEADTVLVSGMAEPNSTLTLTLKDNPVSGTSNEVTKILNVGADGHWSLAGQEVDMSSWMNGDVMIAAVTKDAAGNISDQAVTTIKLDTVKPDNPDVSLADDTGAVDGITAVSELILGNRETGADVEYRFKLEDGNWSEWKDWDNDPFSEAVNGVYTVETKQTDEAGNVSDVDTLNFTLDTSSPVDGSNFKLYTNTSQFFTLDDEVLLGINNEDAPVQLQNSNAQGNLDIPANEPSVSYRLENSTNGNSSNNGRISIRRTVDEGATDVTGGGGNDVVTGKAPDYEVYAKVTPGKTKDGGVVDPNKYQFNYNAGATGVTITSLIIDLQAGGNDDAEFHFGGSGNAPIIGDGGTVQSVAGFEYINPDDDKASAVRVNFTPGSFSAGESFHFGLHTHNLDDDEGDDFGEEGVSLKIIFSDGTHKTVTYQENDPNGQDNGLTEFSDVTIGGGLTLYGNAGDDVLIGSQNNDKMTGGSGSDTFRFEIAQLLSGEDVQTDTILDFEVKEDVSDNQFDKIDLSNLYDAGAVITLSGWLNNDDAGISVSDSASGKQLDIKLDNLGSNEYAWTDTGSSGLDGDDVLQQLINNGQIIV